MDDLEKLKRHLAKDIPLTFKNSEGVEDTFYFKPLNVEQQATMMEIGKRMETRPKIMHEGNEIPEVNKEDMKEVFSLLLEVFKNSFPQVDEETAKAFVNSNFEQLFEKINDLAPKSRGKSDIDKIRKAREDMKNARKSTTE